MAWRGASPVYQSPLSDLVGGLKRQSRIAHKNAPTWFGQGAVEHQDSNDIARPWRSTVANLDALRGVDTNDNASTAVDLAIDPDLSVVIHVRLKPYAGAGQVDAIQPCGNLHGNAIPGKRKTDRATLPDVGTYLPPRVVILRQARRGVQQLGGQALVGLARD